MIRGRTEWRPVADAATGRELYLDARLGELFDELEQRGRLDNTIVVVTADHGEQFGEHGLMHHGNSLYRPLTHVPLIIIAPDGEDAGLRIRRPVGISDLAATVEDLACLEPVMPGASLWRSADGPVPDTQQAPVFSFHRAGGVAVSSGDYRYIMHADGREELFDVVSDPLEAQDLSGAPGHAAALVRLRAAMEERTVDSSDDGA